MCLQFAYYSSGLCTDRQGGENLYINSRDTKRWRKELNDNIAMNDGPDQTRIILFFRYFTGRRQAKHILVVAGCNKSLCTGSGMANYSS